MTVRANTAEGGTVSPTSQTVAYGTVVNITATPNEGYRFAGFTSSDSSMIPDGSGNLTVTGSVVITANFEPIGGDYVNGILGEYYDASEFSNDSALSFPLLGDRRRSDEPGAGVRFLCNDRRL